MSHIGSPSGQGERRIVHEISRANLRHRGERVKNICRLIVMNPSVTVRPYRTAGRTIWGQDPVTHKSPLCLLCLVLSCSCSLRNNLPPTHYTYYHLHCHLHHHFHCLFHRLSQRLPYCFSHSYFLSCHVRLHIVIVHCREYYSVPARCSLSRI